MNTKLKTYLNTVKDVIANEADIQKFVLSTESGIKTTQNNHGRYMELLSHYNDSKVFQKGVALGLIKAGANRQGVNDALKALNG